MKSNAKKFTALLLVLALVATMTVGTSTPTSNAANATYSGSASYMNGKYYRALTQVKLTGDARTDIINVAKSQIGYLESNSSSDYSGENAGGNNWTEYGRWYGGYPNPAWCAAFVSWCAYVCGISESVIIRHQYTENGINFFKARNQAYAWSLVQSGVYTPQPGDLVYFYNGASGRTVTHVGLVEKFENGILHTIEGNTQTDAFTVDGGCCAPHTYSINDTKIVYICSPGYVASYRTGVHEVITSSSLNVRDAATTSGSNIIGYFTNGDRFNCLEVVNDTWAKIDYYGQTAYVSIKSDYVKYVGGSTAITNPTDLVFDESYMAEWAARGKDSASVVAFHTTEMGTNTARFCATSSTSDPMVYLRFQDTASFRVDDYNYISIVAQTNINKSGAFFLCAGNIENPTPECYVDWQWEGDGMWREYLIDISHLSNFSGVLNQIRFDYFDEAVGAGQGVNIRSIRFLKNKPQPTITASASVINVGDPLKFTYSGMDTYSGGADGMKPTLVILPSWTCPGAGNNNLMLWNYIGSSGEKNLSITDLQVESGFKYAFETYYNSRLPAGEYTAYLSYNTAGNDNFMHSVDLAAAGASVTFTIVEKKATLDVEISNGAASGGLVGTFADGTTVSEIVDAGATVKDVNGNEITGDILLGTGMTVTSYFEYSDGSTYTQTYTVVVKGDANGDGSVDIIDAKALLDHVKTGDVLSVAEMDAVALLTGSADFNILSVVDLLNYI